MKKILLTFVLFFAVLQLFSQNTIGFRSSLLWLKFSTEDIRDEGDSVEDIQITRDFDVDFYFIHERKEKLRWIYQLGYRRFVETRELNAITAGVLDVSTRRRVTRRYRVSIGIENKVELGPLSIFYGIDLPLEYEPKDQNNFTGDIFDDNNNLIGGYESIDYTPNAYRFGCHLNLKFYHFFNRVGLGLEFVNGFSFHKPTKERKSELRVYDINNQLIDSEIFVKEEKRLVIGNTSFVALGLRYILNK